MIWIFLIYNRTAIAECPSIAQRIIIKIRGTGSIESDVSVDRGQIGAIGISYG